MERLRKTRAERLRKSVAPVAYFLSSFANELRYRFVVIVTAVGVCGAVTRQHQARGMLRFGNVLVGSLGNPWIYENLPAAQLPRATLR